MNFRNFNSLTTLYFSQAEKLADRPHLWRKIDKDKSWFEEKNQLNLKSLQQK